MSFRRTLPRTPPAPSCVHALDFSEMQNEEKYDPNCRRSSFMTPPIRQGPSDEPESMVKGMKGYQMTPADLEFMQRLKEEKELKRLQEEAAALENELECRQIALERSLAVKEKAEAELEQLASFEDIRTWALVVLEKSAPLSTDLSDLDIRELLALITCENINIVLCEKDLELIGLEDKLAQKKEKDAEERERLEQSIGIKQVKSPEEPEVARGEHANTTQRLHPGNEINLAKILGLMGTLAELKSSLTRQQEVNLKNQQHPEKADTKEKPGKRVPKLKDKPPGKMETVQAGSGKGTSDTRAKDQRKGKVKMSAAADREAPQNGKGALPKPKSEEATVTRSKRKAVAVSSAPAVNQEVMLRRSKRIACRK